VSNGVQEFQFTNEKSKYLVIQYFVLNFLSFADSHFSVHYVKLTRDLLKTLQSLFMKSLLHYFEIQYCQGSQLQQEMSNDKSKDVTALKDSKALMNLMLFILSPETKLSFDLPLLVQEYKDWVESNSEVLDNIFEFFVTQCRNI